MCTVNNLKGGKVRLKRASFTSIHCDLSEKSELKYTFFFYKKDFCK